MHPQMDCLNRCIITLVAFVRFFSRVSFQMLIQMVCPNRCIVALGAFVWLFSWVSSQMSPIGCLNKGNIALAAFVRFFFRVIFFICLLKFCWLHILAFSPFSFATFPWLVLEEGVFILLTKLWLFNVEYWHYCEELSLINSHNTYTQVFGTILKAWRQFVCSMTLCHGRWLSQGMSWDYRDWKCFELEGLIQVPSEDCLYLNVATPGLHQEGQTVDQNASLPVMVSYYWNNVYVCPGQFNLRITTLSVKSSQFLEGLLQIQSCRFCSNRKLHYFPLSVRPSVCHRRDISHF